MDFGLIFPCIQPFWGLGPTGHCWFTLGTERQRPRLGGEKSVDFGALYWPTWCRLVSCRLGVSSTELTFPTSPADVSVRVSPSPSASCATSHRLRAVPWSCAPTSASALRPACGWVPPDLPWRAGWKGGTVAQRRVGRKLARCAEGRQWIAVKFKMNFTISNWCFTLGFTVGARALSWTWLGFVDAVEENCWKMTVVSTLRFFMVLHGSSHFSAPSDLSHSRPATATAATWERRGPPSRCWGRS